MKYPKALYSVIVKEINNNKVEKKGSLVIPDIGKEKPVYGTVVDPGYGYITQMGLVVESKLKVGDVIAIPKMGGVRLNVDGIDYISVPEPNIIAIIVEDDAE